jgi:hypothetical protein
VWLYIPIFCMTSDSYKMVDQRAELAEHTLSRIATVSSAALQPWPRLGVTPCPASPTSATPAHGTARWLRAEQVDQRQSDAFQRTAFVSWRQTVFQVQWYAAARWQRLIDARVSATWHLEVMVDPQLRGTRPAVCCAISRIHSCCSKPRSQEAVPTDKVAARMSWRFCKLTPRRGKQNDHRGIGSYLRC